MVRGMGVYMSGQKGKRGSVEGLGSGLGREGKAGVWPGVMEGSVGIGNGAGVKGTGLGTRTGAGCGGALGGVSGTTVGAGAVASVIWEEVLIGATGMTRVLRVLVILGLPSVFQAEAVSGIES